MIFGILVLLTALSISAVAIYYSVAGLVAIFAAAAIPIMVMGGTLEVAKLVTAVWLHRYWDQATWWMRTYLSTAVVVLMLITSMGIFGFLSKAHIEQTSASQESIARIETIESEILRQTSIRERAEDRIRQLENSETGANASVQAQIDREQERIDKAYERIQPAIDEQNRIIGSQGKLFQDELDRIDEQLATLQRYIDAGDKDNIRKAQAMIGARQDGSWGSRTAAAAEEWRKGRQQARADLLTKIESATNNPQARAARTEIQRLRRTVEAQIAESNKVINRLRGQLGNENNAQQIQAEIDEQNERIRLSSAEIDKLTGEKIGLESEYRKLEAEVGPIKYIAEFIYGERADTNMLEEAVRWVIVTIIFVFDPLAVLLLLAAQYTFEYHRRNDPKKDNNEFSWEEYEQARAVKINENASWPFTAPEEPKDENTTGEDSETLPETDTTLSTAQEQESAERRDEDDQVVVTTEERKLEVATSYIEETEKETQRLTEEQLEELEHSEEWQTAKSSWKADNPNLNLKFFKELYLEGKIDKLPWEDYLVEATPYIMKKGKEQVVETALKPVLEDNTKEEGYIQNEEQEKENSLWKNIRPKNE